MTPGILNITGGEIASNSSQWGGGINANGHPTVTLSGTGAVKDNTSTANAAGIFLEGDDGQGTTFTMTGGSITGNKAGGNGGGIMGYSYTQTVTINISGGTITGNTADLAGNGIILRGDTSKTSECASLKLSGSPDIKDDVFLQDDWFPDAKGGCCRSVYPGNSRTDQRYQLGRQPDDRILCTGNHSGYKALYTGRWACE